jgi:uncharacterized protein YegP (UPF0339 family)
MSAQWKIIRTPAGYHVTLQAANHEVVLSSEVLTSLESAEDVPRLVEELIIDGYNAHQRLPVAFTDQTLP